MKPLLLQIPGMPVPSDSIPSVKEELSQLKTLSFDELINRLVNNVVEFAIHLAIAIVVFYIGRFIINKVYAVVASILIRRKVDQSLSSFVLSLIKIVLLFILIVTVIGILGIETSSFIAIFASAGVAVGMALSGTLQNFAGGVLILLLKPYKVGDYIEMQGYAGTVKEIQIFSTIICTPDNKSIIIPNGALSTGTINNFSREDYRRVEWTIGISYGDDVDKAREVILQMFADDNRIVRQYLDDDRLARLEAAEAASEERAEETGETDTTLREETRTGWFRRIFRHKPKIKPKTKLEEWRESHDGIIRSMLPKTDCSPMVFVSELASSSVNLSCRAWTRSEFYWSVFFDINERIYKELPMHGISFPFPQMDVHFDKQS